MTTTPNQPTDKSTPKAPARPNRNIRSQNIIARSLNNAFAAVDNQNNTGINANPLVTPTRAGNLPKRVCTPAEGEYLAAHKKRRIGADVIPGPLFEGGAGLFFANNALPSIVTNGETTDNDSGYDSFGSSAAISMFSDASDDSYDPFSALASGNGHTPVVSDANDSDTDESDTDESGAIMRF